MKSHFNVQILLCQDFIKFNEKVCAVFQCMIFETGSTIQVLMKQKRIQGSITNKTR